MPRGTLHSKGPGAGKRRPAATPRTPAHPLDTPLGASVTVILFGVGLALLLALVSYTPDDVPMWTKLSKTNQPNDPAYNLLGVLGAVVAGYGYMLFGAACYLIGAGLCWLGLSRMAASFRLDQRTLGGFVLLVLTGASLAHLHQGLFGDWNLQQNLQSAGGLMGFFFGETFQRLLGKFGATFVLGCLYVVAMILVMGFPPLVFYRLCRRAWHRWLARRKEKAEVTKARSPLSGALAPVPSALATPDRVILPPVEEKVIRRRPKPAEAEPAKPEAPKGEPAAQEPELTPPSEGAPKLEAPPPKPKIIDGSARRPKSGRDRVREETARPSVMGTVSFPDYLVPPLDLLNYDEDQDRHPADEHVLIDTQDKIVETLATFGVEVTPGDITRGPSITRYEIYPSKGLRVNKISTLEADIARATMAERINILAPIPGKDTVGIEIANKQKIAVPLRELLDDPNFTQAKAKLPLALGKDVYGNPVIADLAQMPHLLVAGTTGSGKSVCINAIIACLLFQFTPDQLRFIMIDPKVVEMQIYNQLPHLVVPVVTDPKKVILALRWVIREMERRYQIFAKEGKRNFEAFNNRVRSAPMKPAARHSGTNRSKSNVIKLGETLTQPELPLTPPAELEAGPALEPVEERALAGVGEAVEPNDITAPLENPPFFIQRVKIGGGDFEDSFDDEDVTSELAVDLEDGDDEEMASPSLPPVDEIEIPETLPYIVVIIDELADLMQTAPADMEMCIARITQMARAAGIHLIVATQTPRADVVTGVIKANIPSRIAFQVASGIDSRVILDAKGADRLVGKGDMLYLPPGASQLIRAQGALVSDDEIQRLVEFCARQGEPAYESEVQATLDGRSSQGGDVSDEDEEILEKCLEVIRQEKRASTSLMQRRLGLGYTRAARMMDILEERGYVGPGDGAKPREILVDLTGEL